MPRSRPTRPAEPANDPRPTATRHLVRAVGNAVNLSSVLGLGLALAGRAQLSRGPQALLLAEHYRLPLPKAGAFTIGNVVLVPKRTLAELEQLHPGTAGHEAAHAWQYFGFLGLPFLLLHWKWKGRTKPVRIIGPKATEALAKDIAPARSAARA